MISALEFAYFNYDEINDERKMKSWFGEIENLVYGAEFARFFRCNGEDVRWR